MTDTKALAVAQYILARRQQMGDQLTPMQLIKMTYVAQGYMLGQHGRPLFNESVQAWQYGPVVPSVYHAVKHYRNTPVQTVPGGLHADFTTEEKHIMDKVADTYGGHNGIILSTATHQPGTPWHMTWSACGQNASISNDLIENFYAELLKQPTHYAL